MPNHELATLVSDVIDGKEPGPLIQALLALDREDIHGQSAIRFLMAKNKWDFTPGESFDKALEHLFGAFEDRKPISSEEYIKTTHDFILETWGVDLPDPNLKVVSETKPKRPVKKTEPASVASKPKKRVMTPVPSDASLMDRDIDLAGASDRLKKTIKIQRGK